MDRRGNTGNRPRTRTASVQRRGAARSGSPAPARSPQRAASPRGRSASARPRPADPRCPRTGGASASRRTAAPRAERRAPVTLIAFAATLAVLAAAAFFALSTCTKPLAQQERTPYQSPYAWENLDWSSGRPVYYQNGQAASRIGVDVSSHQGWIDWSAVAADGIDFAIVRAGNRGYTEGALSADEYFDYNLDGASAAGLDVGVYFFSQALNEDEAREEARFVVELLTGRELQLPVAFDHEPITSGAQGRADHVTGDQLAACARAFCETVEAAGYDALVYGNASDLARFTALDGSAQAAGELSDLLGGRPVWLAEYDVAAPTAALDFALWQYTSTGQVAGIDTNVDLNILLPAA